MCCALHNAVPECRRGCGALIRGPLMSDSRARQSAKMREIRDALLSEGIIGLDAQAATLGLARSTTWTILNGTHKSSGLSATTINRMLAAPELTRSARLKILEYIAEKRSGRYGDCKSRLRRFTQRLACGMER